MRLLLTNDDGIHSDGITVLADTLSVLGEIWVVAPDRERNATSHTLTLHRPLRLTNLSEYCYAVNGTPADCVNIGINFLLPERPDLIVSGINRGGNLGNDINYSGTVAGAVEGALMGVPSFSISLSAEREFNFKPAAQFALRLARCIAENGLPEKTVLNVNVPDSGGEEINRYTITTQGTTTHTNTIEEKTDPRGFTYYWIGRKHDIPEESNPADTSDLKALRGKSISITPLNIDRTHYGSYEALKRSPL
jgi:5'-nucleotidase